MTQTEAGAVSLAGTSATVVPARATGPGAHVRLPALDGIRGMAVLMVLAFHYHQGMLPGARAWFSEPARLLNIGQTGVDLFFVLSGFLITRILLDAKGSPHFLRNFYARRALRILPLYYLVVVGCLVAGWVGSNPAYRFDRVWWYLVYLQNFGSTFWPHLVGGPGHFWSLGVEEHFYLFWPFLILYCSDRKLPAVLLALIAGCVLCRVVMLVLGYDVFTFSPCRLDALASGALLALLLSRPDFAGATGGFCRWTLPLLGAGLAVLYPLTSGRALFVMQSVKYLLIAVAYASLLGATVGPGRVSWLESLFSAGWLRWCGKYSYAMYVFHPFTYRGVMMLMRSHMRGWMTSRPEMFMCLEFSACLASAVAAAWVSWNLFEKHFLQFKSRYA